MKVNCNVMHNVEIAEHTVLAKQWVVQRRFLERKKFASSKKRIARIIKRKWKLKRLLVSFQYSKRIIGELSLS